MDNIDLKFMDKVKKIIYAILRKENILQGQWHMGTIKNILSSYMLEVYIDGSNESQKIPCNPNIKFYENEKVWVLYANNDSKNKYVPFKRSTGQELIDEQELTDIKIGNFVIQYNSETESLDFNYIG